MATITKVKSDRRVVEKRFYMPGVCIHDACPVCGEEMVRDLGSSCLYYPVLNEPSKVGMYCNTGHTWEVPVFITVDIKVIDEPRTETIPQSSSERPLEQDGD